MSFSTSHPRLAGVILALVVLVATLAVPSTSAEAASYDADAEGQFLNLLNHERSARGLASVKMVTGVKGVARDWSDTMKANGKLYHRPDLSAPFTGAWTRLGENVGVGPSVTSLHDAFMASDGHRANILGDWQYVGIGVSMQGSKIWVTVNFVKGDPSVKSVYETIGGTTSSTTRFSDTGGNTHEANIERLAAAGITKGCGGDKFCPDAPVTRQQFASFMSRAMELASAPVRFSDVTTSNPHYSDIGALAAAGITKGCGPDTFCPTQAVTRAQMASFLVRALDLPSADSTFADVPRANVHVHDIGALAASGITKGCGGNDYCPNRSITRAEMATFLVRAFDL